MWFQACNALKPLVSGCDVLSVPWSYDRVWAGLTRVEHRALIWGGAQETRRNPNSVEGLHAPQSHDPFTYGITQLLSGNRRSASERHGTYGLSAKLRPSRTSSEQTAFRAMCRKYRPFLSRTFGESASDRYRPAAPSSDRNLPGAAAETRVVRSAPPPARRSAVPSRCRTVCARARPAPAAGPR